MQDLTKITTPFGLLDEETQKALKAHGGPYERYEDNGVWAYIEQPHWCLIHTYRVKPAPREWFIVETQDDRTLTNARVKCMFEDEATAKAMADLHKKARVVRVREVEE